MATSDSLPKLTLATTGRRSNLIVEPFYVMAFDPGGTTGWSSVSYLGDPVVGNDLSLDDFSFKCGEFTGEHHDELATFIEGEIPTPDLSGIKMHLVTEAFTFRQFATDESYGKAKVELISCEYIGVIKMLAQRWNLPVYSYMASEGKGFVTNEKLDKLGWLQTPLTPNRHKNDASRQLVSALVKKLKIRHPITTVWRD